MEKFSRSPELRDSPAGLRLRLAMSEGNIALHEMRKLRVEYGLAALDRSGTPYARMQSWRRQYVRSCEIASQAITQLSELHGWPTEGQHMAEYRFKPKREV